MRRNRRNSVLLAIALLVPLLAAACGTTYSSPPPEYPRGDVEGSRYETMRGLADRLVNRLEATRDELRATRNREAETPLFGDLLDRARRFRDKLEDYSNPPRYVRADVDEIDRLAREYDAQTHNVSASTRAVQTWSGAQRVIDRMQRLLAGAEVDIPADDDTTPYPTGPGNPPYPPYPGGDTSPSGSVLSGSTLDDVRRAAHEVLVRATLARDNADRAGATSGDSDRRLIADLSYFVSGARELENRTNAETSVDRRDLRPFVERLMEDARRIDTSLRGSGLSSRAGRDWTEVLRLLQMLADQTR